MGSVQRLSRMTRTIGQSLKPCKISCTMKKCKGWEHQLEMVALVGIPRTDCSSTATRLLVLPRQLYHQLNPTQHAALRTLVKDGPCRDSSRNHHPEPQEILPPHLRGLLRASSPKKNSCETNNSRLLHHIHLKVRKPISLLLTQANGHVRNAHCIIHSITLLARPAAWNSRLSPYRNIDASDRHTHHPACQNHHHSLACEEGEQRHSSRPRVD